MTEPLPIKKNLVPIFDSDEEKGRILAQFDMAEIEGIALFGGRLIVAKWIRDKVGRIIVPAGAKNEDNYQGKVGLVLKVGPMAFEDDANHNWYDMRAKVGDWVMYGHSDGADFDYSKNGTHDRVPCKMLDEVHVQAILPRPDFAY